jgi:transposase
MEKVSIIGLDLAKRSFQAHGALTEGGVAFRKKLSREKVLGFFAEQPCCIVAMEGHVPRSGVARAEQAARDARFS